jgi:prolyl oligopeptidase
MGKTLFLPLLVSALFACAHINPHAGQPVTSAKPVMDEYHGVKVIDEYQWLEDRDDSEVRKWTDAQNAYARGILDKLPSVDKIRKRVEEIVNLTPVRYRTPYWRGGKLFALKFKPPLNQPLLVVMPSPDGPQAERVIINPNDLDKEGSIAIDWYVPSPDGALVAVSLSSGGSESGDVHIYETDTGKEVEEVIPRVNGGTAGGDLEWAPDGSGFYYTRYPREKERLAEDMDFFQELWFHSLGTTAKHDRYELGKGFAKIAEIEVDVESGTGRVLASVQDGDSGRFAFFVRDAGAAWRRIAGFDDGIAEAIFGPDGGLFLVTQNEAPRGKVLWLPTIDTPVGQARRIVAEGADAILTNFYGSDTMIATDTRLYVTYQLGGPSEIRVFDHGGRRLPGPDIPPVSSIGRRIIPLDGDDILFSSSAYIEPTSWYRFSARDGRTVKTALSTSYPIDFSDVEVIRDFALSRDGTKVPVNIIRKKSVKLKGQNPVLLTGYGGYGFSYAPGYDPIRRIWFDNGGVFAVANLRGGGEYGEKWHRDGMLENKQNVFDDFHACMRYMVETGYTTPEKLVIEGGSNGGLLMGAMITQHPADMKAVVSFVGIYDMLRFELSPNGKFNVPELGTVENKDLFEAMHEYSPYHRVKDRTQYPAVLFLTGANDPRVDPMHSRKMTARLQAANVSGNPILLRTNSNTGHGIGSPLSEQIEEQVDVLSFIFNELGIDFQTAWEQKK